MKKILSNILFGSSVVLVIGGLILTLYAMYPNDTDFYHSFDFTLDNVLLYIALPWACGSLLISLGVLVFFKTLKKVYRVIYILLFVIIYLCFLISIALAIYMLIVSNNFEKVVIPGIVYLVLLLGGVIFLNIYSVKKINKTNVPQQS